MRATSRGPWVRSVTGPVAPAELGHILAHEHLVIDYGQMAGRATPVDETTLGTWAGLLADLRKAGIGTVVDCTPPGYGRDLDLLAKLSRDSGVRIVASTGSFCEEWHPLPDVVRDASSEQLTDRFLADLTARPGPAAGVIKVATSHHRITANEEKVLIAAARAHLVCGAPIVAHTTAGLGPEQLDLFARQGVDLSAVLVSHVCASDEPFAYAVEIARRGAYVGLDRIGHTTHGLTHWADLVLHLTEKGLGERIVLSHDSVQRFTGPAAIAEHSFRDPLLLTEVFLPLLQRRGVDTGTLRLLTHDNPARWLTRKEANRP